VTHARSSRSRHGEPHLGRAYNEEFGLAEGHEADRRSLASRRLPGAAVFCHHPHLRSSNCFGACRTRYGCSLRGPGTNGTESGGEPIAGYRALSIMIFMRSSASESNMPMAVPNSDSGIT